MSLSLTDGDFFFIIFAIKRNTKTIIKRRFLTFFEFCLHNSSFIYNFAALPGTWAAWHGSEVTLGGSLPPRQLFTNYLKLTTSVCLTIFVTLPAFQLWTQF